jgi:hypothetical protein
MANGALTQGCLYGISGYGYWFVGSLAYKAWFNSMADG